MSRRQFGSDGKIHSTLAPYVQVVKQMAADKNVPLLDLHARSIELFERLGKEGCDRISPPNDHTHLNPQGAQAIAPLVADELEKAVPELAGYLK